MIFFEIMTEQTSPVCLERVMDRMPVPVFYQSRTGCHMAERLLPKLPRIRCPTWVTLCLCLKNEIIILFQGTGHITAKGDFRTGQFVLRRMVNVASCHSQRLFCNFKMIIGRLYTIGISAPLKIQIVGDKLIRTGILFYNI